MLNLKLIDKFKILSLLITELDMSYKFTNYNTKKK